MAEKQKVMVGMMAADTAKRRESYKNLINMLGDSGNTLEWSDHMDASETMNVFQNLKADLTSQNDKEVLDAASVCIHLLASPSFVAAIDTCGQKSLCEILIKILKTKKNRKIMYTVLQSLAESKLKKEAYFNDLEENFDVLREILLLKDPPSSVICEALQVVMILFNACPDTSIELGKLWFPITFSKMFNTSVIVRKSALIITSKVRKTIDQMSDPTVRSAVLKPVLLDLKDKYCKDMVRLVLGGDFDILQVWREIVVLLGPVLHSSRSLINCLLNVVEKAFKISDPEVRIESFNCWRTIIDNFALDKNSLTNQMKLKLLLAPFKINNARTEDVCSVKLDVWWHLVCLLSHHKNLAINFDMTVVPLLYFCFIGGLPSERNKAGLSNRNLILSCALSSPHRNFSSLHISNAEVLAQILATDSDDPKYKYSLPVIGERVMSSAVFMRHHPLLLKCFEEAIQTLNFSNDRQNSIGTLIFSFLLAHIRTITTADVQKKEVVDVVKELFNTLSHIESVCRPGDSQSRFLFKFFNLLTVGDLALPKKVLNSHQYHIPTSSNGDAQDIMCGTLSNHLITQLCRPALLHHSLSGNEFIKLWTTVLENSQPATGKLRFLQAAIQELSVSSISFLCPDHPSILCSLWNVVLRQMVAHLTKTKASDGDDSEPDWSSVYTILHFPVVHATEAFTCAPFDLFQQIMEMWEVLWKKFIRITSATPTLEPNSEVEHVAATLLTLCHKKTNDVPDVHTSFYILTVEFLVQLTTSFQYAKLGKAAQEVSPSPTKAKKPHPLHNLGSIMELTVKVFRRVCSMVSSRRMYMAERLCVVALTMMKGIQLAPMKYLQEFINQMMKMLVKCVRVNPAVVFDFKVEKKCISLLRSFSGLIKAYVTHKETTQSALEDLNVLELLFGVAFNSTNKKIKQKVQKLIENIIVSIGDASLDVPPFLLQVQGKWDISAAKATSVDDSINESMEDFIDATPEEKRTSKSLSGLNSNKLYSPRNNTPSSSSNSKLSSPRKHTPVSSKKQIAEQSIKKEDKRAAAAATPPTRYSVRVRKNELQSGKNNTGAASPIPLSSPATPDNFSRLVSSSTSSEGAVTRVIRTCRNAPSPQNREEKHTTSQLTVNSEDKERRKGATSQPPHTSEPIVTSSTESDKIPKDSEIKGTNSEHKQQNNSLSHTEQVEEDPDSSGVLWKSEESPVAVPNKAQDKGNRREAKIKNVNKEMLDKRNEDLCAVLHDTSLEVQKLLYETYSNKENDESTNRKKAKHEEISPPHKASETTNAVEEIPAKKKKRINFMEVNVSPSVVMDAKLVERRTKVKITAENLKEMGSPESPVVVHDSDNEDGLPDVTKSMPENTLKSKSNKKPLKEILSQRLKTEEQVENGKQETSSSGPNRKRKLFHGKEESVEALSKRRKTERTAQNHDSSSEDSIIELGSSNSEDILTKSAKETKSLRRTRSHPGQTDTDKEEKTNTPSAFSPKVTRSGRKIVPPKKDMPEPMTPPKKAKKKLHHEADPSQAEESEKSSSGSVNLSNSVSSHHESTKSVLTEGESRLESEMEVDQPSVEEVNVLKNDPKKGEQIDNEAKEIELDCDMSVTIIESYDALTSTKNGSSAKSKMEETENLKNLSSKTHKDNVKTVDKSSGITEKDDLLVEDKESSCILVEETPVNENENNSSEKPKSTSDEQAPEEERPQETPEKEKGMDPSEESSDIQKTSEESTLMECGQDLEGEVSYPAARPGTEVLDDSASPEGEDQHEAAGEPVHINKEAVDDEVIREEDGKVKETEDIDSPLSVEELDEKDDDEEEGEEEDDREEEGNISSDGEITHEDSPTSPEPENEDEDEEEDYLSAGQEQKEEDEQGEKMEKTKVADADKMQQEGSNDGVQESEKNVLVVPPEEENLERTNSASDKETSKLEEITIPVTKESDIEKMDTSSHESQEKDSVSSKEMEVMKDTNVISENVMAVEDDSEMAVKVQEELPEAHIKECEQQHTVLDKTVESELQEDHVSVSKNVQNTKESEDAPSTTKDSDEIEAMETECNECDDSMNKEEKESQQIGSEKKQLVSEEINFVEEVTHEEESLDSLRKEIISNLTSESVIDEVDKTVFSPKALKSSKVTFDSESDKTISSPCKNVVTTKMTCDTDEKVVSPRKNVKLTPVDSKGTPPTTPDTIKAVLSPSKNVEVNETVPISVKEIQVNQTVSSPRKTDTVSSPRKTVHMKEIPNSPIKSNHDGETVSSPQKAVMATEAVTPTPGRTQRKPLEDNTDTKNHEVDEKEAHFKVPHHTERTADTEPEVTPTAPILSEVLQESVTNSRQQEEELSPDKSSRSRLNLTVSTPERMKQRGALMHAGSRAALLVACAKKNIKNRGGGESESPTSVLSEGVRSRSLGLSPVRRSVPGRPSPGQSPDGRRKSLLDRPWVKHTPSPGASPSPSILKRTLLNDSLDGDTPSPPTKYRRVSFADPPVSERVEIPPSPRTLKGIRAQKRLDMTRMASEVKDSDVQPVEKQLGQETEPEGTDPCPALHTCQDRVDQVASLLTSTSMLPGLLTSLDSMGVTTVGQLCKLNEWDINSLPIKPPKVTNIRRVLKEYEKTWTRENSTTNSPVADDVEVSLAKMFGELDDKENLTPNHQECAAPEVTKDEAQIKESAGSGGRSPHSDNIQKIMDMEEITPLYSSPEETEEDTLKNLYRRASEDDLDSQKKLLDHLLLTLPAVEVAEAVARCIKARLGNVTTTTT